LQACDIATVLLLCCDGGSSRQAALEQWRAEPTATLALPKFYFIYLFIYLFKAASTTSFTHERGKEKENEKLLYVQESEKGSFETCLVSLFSQLLSSFFVVGSPPILALLVGSQAPSNKLLPTVTTPAEQQ
jgi:hypothetical protein